MLIVMKTEHQKSDLDQVVQLVESLGFKAHILPGEHSVAVGITGNSRSLDPAPFLRIPGVEETIPVTKQYKLAGREFKKTDTLIRLSNLTIGHGFFVVMAGPCAVESEEQTLRIARQVKSLGADVLRGGAYKPRTSPYAFQGLGEDGLKILKTAREETGLPVVTEALDPKSLELVYQYADIIQIGTRNMQNFALLQEAGKLDKPVVLKRGFSSTIEEWLMAAEYILTGGNSQVILCERGIRSFDSYSRNLLDLSVVTAIRKLSHLPIIVDPSHSTGRREQVIPMSKGALAVGADGLLIDVHDRPEEALCDGPQALLPADFKDLMQTLNKMAHAIDVKRART